jgi:hypothetical protein
MDPLHPITPGPPAMPTRRVPPVDRLARITRDGDRPGRETEERRNRARERPAEAPEDGEERGPGHIDVRV